MQGFTDVATRYFFKLTIKAIKERKWYIFDAGLYILQPFVTLLLGVSTVMAMVQSRMPHGADIFLISDMLGNVGFKIFVLIQFILTPLVLIMDKKISKGVFAMLVLFSSNVFLFPLLFDGIKDGVVLLLINVGYYAIFLIATYVLLGKRSLIFFWRYLLYGIYTLTWIPITVQGIHRRKNKEWNPTKHVRNVEICDV